MLLSSLHTLVRVVLFGAASAAKVTSLPGLATSPCFNHSSGYLSTGTSRDTHLFYWYHEAVADPKSKPLLLWLNGGPGCSSLGGMFTELGPFIVQKTLNVTFNPYSFNKVANVLFLEQPAGVGFSDLRRLQVSAPVGDGARRARAAAAADVQRRGRVQ